MTMAGDPRDPDSHYVSDTPYDRVADLQALDRKDLDASTRVLIWRRFRRNRLAMLSGLFLLLMYLALPFAGMLAPYDPGHRNSDAIFAPPENVDFFDVGILCNEFQQQPEVPCEAS